MVTFIVPYCTLYPVSTFFDLCVLKAHVHNKVKLPRGWVRAVLDPVELNPISVETLPVQTESEQAST